MNDITISVLTANVVIMLFCGSILLKKRKETGDISRTYLGVFLMAAAGLIAVYLISLFLNKPVTHVDQMLDPTIITTGLWAITLYMLYPILVMRADKLKTGYIILLFIPAALMTVPHLTGMNFIELYNWEDFTRNLNRPDVIIRLAGILIALIISILLIVIPYNWRHSSADFKWIRLVTLLSQGITLFYILKLFTTQYIFTNLHMTWASLASLYYVKYELNDRIIPSPKSDTEESNETPISDIIDRSHDLWTNIDHIMNKNQIWRNPNTTAETLSKDMGTNRIYVADCIRKHTGLTFNDYLNRERAMFMADQLRLDPKQDQKSLYYDAGFRSRQTAYRNFVKFIGCSPTDYVSAL